MARNDFEKASCDEFLWQTRHPYIAVTESRLLDPIRGRKDTFLLDVGAGQGASLFHLNPSRSFGIDRSIERLKFARTKQFHIPFVCAYGEHLPFRSAVFETALIRDVLHHVDNPSILLKEISRVLRADGVMNVIEPNGRNPIIWGWTWLAFFDRRVRRNSYEYLRNLLSLPFFRIEQVIFQQPLPISRAVFHYRVGIRFGFPGLMTFVRALERLFGLVIPKKCYAYFNFVLRKRQL